MVTWKISNLLVVIIALLIGVSLYRSRLEDASNDEGIKDLNIKSVIRRKFTAVNNHNTHYLIYGKDSISTYDYWDPYINVGDSIVKPENSTKLIIKNINKYIEFDYNNPRQLPPP